MRKSCLNRDYRSKIMQGKASLFSGRAKRRAPAATRAVLAAVEAPKTLGSGRFLPGTLGKRRPSAPSGRRKRIGFIWWFRNCDYLCNRKGILQRSCAILLAARFRIDVTNTAGGVFFTISRQQPVVGFCLSQHLAYNSTVYR